MCTALTAAAVTLEGGSSSSNSSSSAGEAAVHQQAWARATEEAGEPGARAAVRHGAVHWEEEEGAWEDITGSPRGLPMPPVRGGGGDAGSRAHVRHGSSNRRSTSESWDGYEEYRHARGECLPTRQVALRVTSPRPFR